MNSLDYVGNSFMSIHEISLQQLSAHKALVNIFNVSSYMTTFTNVLKEKSVTFQKPDFRHWFSFDKF